MDVVDALYENPGKVLHPVTASEGYTLPPRRDLLVYRLNEPTEVEAARKAHDLLLHPGKGRDNLLLIDRALKLPKLKLEFRGSGNLCVLGRNATANGKIELHKDGGKVVVAGGPQVRVLRLEITLQADEQRVFVGEGTSAEGMATSMRGTGAALIIGDDCMFSWRVWFRPSDMHAIVDLQSGAVVNPAQDIVVEPHVWIGQEALIVKGVVLGAGSVVGAKSLVTGGKAYPRMSILAGNPARPIRSGVSWDRAHDDPPSEMAERVRSIAARYPVLPSPQDAQVSEESSSPRESAQGTESLAPLGGDSEWAVVARRLRKFARNPRKFLLDARSEHVRAVGEWFAKKEQG